MTKTDLSRERSEHKELKEQYEVKIAENESLQKKLEKSQNELDEEANKVIDLTDEVDLL
eukprot:CAMPEP_0176338502 /NCGR_PEP_ID=MMETSP0126-20121128/15_1 /TAXON_ID=141414 ORGANISM="Strombidinopsis acuminatum, Strain SPMC142" /NCGR_SAMPLE_ID=MMETSP0126 /ASSEMBLY_ACC=CAM_ASM_000229 /LENGTH=58 /DNA_ID=CAMNT_0017681529 /DNA_START=1383 /DNA_END=1559 /DNA_ORIENTATION=-